VAFTHRSHNPSFSSSPFIGDVFDVLAPMPNSKSRRATFFTQNYGSCHAELKKSCMTLTWTLELLVRRQAPSQLYNKGAIILLHSRCFVLKKATPKLLYCTTRTQQCFCTTTVLYNEVLRLRIVIVTIGSSWQNMKNNVDLAIFEAPNFFVYLYFRSSFFRMS